MSRIRIVSLSLATAFALAACGGGGHSASVVPPALTYGGGAQPTYAVTNFSYDTKTLKKSQFVGSANLGGFGFDLMLKPSNLNGLLQYAKQASTPGSGVYRQFLTPQQIGERYGAPATAVAAAKKYFSAFGIGVTTWPQNLMMHVSGSQSALESAFNTKFGIYKLGTQTVIGPTRAPSLPSSLGIAGSPNIVVWPSRFVKPNVKGSSPVSNAVIGYSPQQVAAGFDYSSAYNAGYNGSGITVGVIGTGPIAVSGVNGITLGDVDAMKSLFGVARPGGQIVQPPVGNAAGGAAYSSGGFTTPLPVNNGSGCDAYGNNPADGLPGSVSPSTTCNPEDGETQIDSEQTALLAPGAKIEYYLAYNPNDFCNTSGTPGNGMPVSPATCAPGSGIPAQGLFEADAEIQQAIADNTADTLSLSYGESEIDVQETPNVTGALTYQAFEQSEFAALATEGIATFVSSGDYGASSCQQEGPSNAANGLCVSYPASDPNVVAVGGVTIPLNAGGQLEGPIAAWGVQTFGGNAGSGGGLSILFSNTFQTGVDYYTSGGEQPLTVRGVPDVSLLGDPATGVAVVTDADASLGGYSNYTLIYGGTSVAAPEMAAMWSLVLQACKQTAACGGGFAGHSYRLGNPNSLFYHIYGTGSGTGAQYGSTFYNVVYGSNQQLCGGGPAASPCPTTTPSLLPGYSAGPGYNLVTGIGAPFARALIKTIVGV